MKKETYESWSRLIAFLLKVIGVIGIIFVPTFWAMTGRVELAFLPFFGTMAGIGIGIDALKEINETKGAQADALEEALKEINESKGAKSDAHDPS